MKIDSRIETIDPILGGDLTIVQPISGYRFSIDAILLGRFARPGRRDDILELGAGSGVVAAMIAAAYPATRVTAIEVQLGLADLVRRNAALNHLDNLAACHADLRDRAIPGVGRGTFAYIVANPPYRAADRGRESPHPGRRLARGSAGASLTDFIDAAAHYVTGRGKVAMIFTATRTAELIAALKAHALEPKRLRFVHAYTHSPASSLLVEARKRGGLETVVEAPLVIWARRGEYSAEVRAMLTAASPDVAGGMPPVGSSNRSPIVI